MDTLLEWAQLANLLLVPVLVWVVRIELKIARLEVITKNHASETRQLIMHMMTENDLWIKMKQSHRDQK